MSYDTSNVVLLSNGLTVEYLDPMGNDVSVVNYDISGV